MAIALKKKQDSNWIKILLVTYSVKESKSRFFREFTGFAGKPVSSAVVDRAWQRRAGRRGKRKGVRHEQNPVDSLVSLMVQPVFLR